MSSFGGDAYGFSVIRGWRSKNFSWLRAIGSYMNEDWNRPKLYRRLGVCLLREGVSPMWLLGRS
jgi:hypothetical protein